jgi:mono/diheme cytochrome c family protein
VIRRALRIGSLVAFLVFIGVVGALMWTLLSTGMSARESPSALESYVATRLRRLAMPRAAREATNPVPASPEVLKEAMEHFADHCATCHANDGSGNTGIGRGLFPKAPDMRAAGTQELTDGELYYIIHNGVRFTGMPAFGSGQPGDSDEANWKLVHFIRRLPGITIEELERMKELNPKSPAELAEEEALRKFLRGEADAPSSEGHSSHH